MNIFPYLILMLRTFTSTTSQQPEAEQTLPFKELATKKYFVDKTELISDLIILGQNASLITCPHGFGKTTTLDMINQFFRIEIDDTFNEYTDKTNAPNYRFFTMEHNFTISAHPKIVNRYLGQYPTIFLSFTDITGKSVELVKTGIRKAISNAYKQFLWLYKNLLRKMILAFSEFKQIPIPIPENADEDQLRAIVKERKIEVDPDVEYFGKNYKHLSPEDVRTSMKVLVDFLYNYFEKPVYLLVDEYTGPLYHAILQDLPALEIDDYVTGIFTSVLRPNSHVKGAILTGVSETVRTLVNSAINSIHHYRFLQSEISVYFGFTEKEVEELLKRYSLPRKMKRLVKQYYNGYRIFYENVRESVYSPRSVVGFLTERRLKSYQEQTEPLGFLKNVLQEVELKRDTRKLITQKYINSTLVTNLETTGVTDLIHALHGGTVHSQRIRINSNVLYSYLHELGILTLSRPPKKWHGMDEVGLHIPNDEMMYRYNQYVMDHYIRAYELQGFLLRNVTDAIVWLLGTEESSIKKGIEKLQVPMNKLFGTYGILAQSNIFIEDFLFSLLIHVATVGTKLNYFREDEYIEYRKLKEGAVLLNNNNRTPIAMIFGLTGGLKRAKRIHDLVQKESKQVENYFLKTYSNEFSKRLIMKKVIVSVSRGKMVSMRYTVRAIKFT